MMGKKGVEEMLYYDTLELDEHCRWLYALVKFEDKSTFGSLVGP
jgi:hypothetical protein